MNFFRSKVSLVNLFYIESHFSHGYLVNHLRLIYFQISNEVQLLSHLKGRQHSEAVKKVHDGREPGRDELQKYNISQIKDFQNSTTTISDTRAANKEKLKALKRRSRKIKQRMTARGQEHEDSVKSEEITPIDSSNKSKFRKNLKELDKLCQNHSKTTWSVVAVSSLERCLGEIARSFSKSVSSF